ncbi:MAG: helix-turn-helix domain-containing protein [Ruminococcus sp.]
MQNLEQYGCSSGEDSFHGRYCSGKYGFAGASYFSETFRKEMGCSPADYRKWYRDLSDECPIITGENKEESAKVSKKDKKGKSGKNVPSYLL